MLSISNVILHVHITTCAVDLLVEQLQAFEKRWLGKVSSKGEPVLSAAAQKEIKNVKAHMMKGCLSGTSL